ncbi:MAG: tripartite tricarboxylate transporter substrate binding protein [Burkholderiales bacterium]
MKSCPLIVPCILVASSFAVSGVSHAQYPAKPIRIIAPSAAGATTDVVARLLAQKLSDSLRQQVIVDNRPGAGGNLSAELVAKAPPDGYTLLLGIPGLATNPFLYSKLSYNPQKDFAPITLVSSGALALVVHPALPVTTVSQLIELARKRPGDLSFPSVGAGTTSHLSGELFKTMAKVDMLHVPYTNFGQALVDLASGRVTFMINAMPGLLHHIQSGRLRAVAVTGKTRSPLMPELPTVAESGLRGYEVVTWNGILAPAATPPDIVARLNDEIGKGLKSPDLREKFRAMDFETIPGSPETFSAWIRSESDKWGRVIKATGARAE